MTYLLIVLSLFNIGGGHTKFLTVTVIEYKTIDECREAKTRISQEDRYTGYCVEKSDYYPSGS